MPNSNYLRGRRAEYKVMRTLEALGYVCMRTAGSHGLFDVIALLQKDNTELPSIRFIQVKVGKHFDKKTLKLLGKVKPDNISKELWWFKPEIEIICCNPFPT